MAFSSIYVNNVERELEAAAKLRDELQKKIRDLELRNNSLREELIEVRTQLQFSEQHTTELSEYIQELEDTLGLRNQS